MAIRLDRSLFRALRHPNYRLFFVGQGVSLIGTWMQQIGEVWLAYRLTNSAFYLGVVGFASQIPIFLFAPIAGVWIDRMDRRKLLIATQVLQMVLAFLLAWLTLSHRITLSSLIVLSIIGGIVDAFDIPTRQSFVVRMVADRADLPNAIALNSSLVNAARLAGPSVAGFLIAAVGEGWCFALNGGSFLAVLFSLFRMNVSPEEISKELPPLGAHLGEGFRYVRDSRVILSLLALLATLSFITSANSVLVPIFADRVLLGGPKTLGLLMAASGLGALTAALVMAARKTVIGLVRRLVTSAMLLGAGLFLFSVSRQIWLSCLAISVAGFSMMFGAASINTVLQTIVEEDKRGRVMSFFAASFIGIAPIGNFLGGVVADYIGAPLTVRLGSLLSFAIAGVFLTLLPKIREDLRAIYIRLGILDNNA